SCPKRGRSPTSLVTAWPRWPSRAGRTIWITRSSRRRSAPLGAAGQTPERRRHLPFADPPQPSGVALFVMRRAATAARLTAVALCVAACGSSSNGPTIKGAMLRDPAACKDCHPKQYAEWSGSMHAYASDDPIFTAMNKRGQRETGGALGDFCVKCHAPMAVHEGQTTDGLNLASLPAPMKGVTCYFCHAAESVDTSIPHNNPLRLVTDDRLFGPFGDPAPAPHSALYSPLLDSSRAESAAACGTCHDIVNTHGAAIERTYQEWQASLFSSPNTGLTCASTCHMTLPATGPAPASEISPQHKRDLHNHGFPAVDVALSAFPEADTQKQQIQALLDTTVQTTICLDPIARK